MQAALTTMARMFDRVSLQTNLDKNKAMICTLEFIWEQHGAEAYTWKSTGEVSTFKEMKRTKVS